MVPPMGGEELPPMGDEQMPMDDNQMMGDEQIPMDNEMPSQDGSEFDTNFDAGVEADEESDPKKYIQQLTGKLSQTLVSYNNELGEPDTELGKYVLGMLIKQGTKGMDEKEKKEIIKKINIGNNEEESNDSENVNDGPNDMEMDNEELPQENEENMQIESKSFKFTKKQIFENYNMVLNVDSPNEEKIDTKITNDTVRNNKTKPFQAPSKFKI